MLRFSNLKRITRRVIFKGVHGVWGTMRAMQYLRDYWGPLPPQSLMGLPGAWYWHLEQAVLCVLQEGTLSACGGPQSRTRHHCPFPRLPVPVLAKPNQELKGKRACSQSDGARGTYPATERSLTERPRSVWV